MGFDFGSEIMGQALTGGLVSGGGSDIFLGWDPDPTKSVGPVDPAGVISGTGAAGGEYGSSIQMLADPMDLFGHQAGAAAEQQKAIEQQALNLQRGWMDYIRKEYAPYSEVAQEALTAQRGLAGLGEPGAREEMLTEIEADPFYQAKVRAGEEAVLRGASATGGLRSGGTSSNLAQINQMLLGREIEDRYQRLAGLSGQGFMGQQAGAQYGGEALGGITDVLSSMSTGIGARHAAQQEKMGGIASLAGGILTAFSDERLKNDIEQIGEHRSGLPWYRWTWNETASKKFDLKGEAVGFMASDVELMFPECVGNVDGFKVVYYGGVH
jgi:hypothetical protein